MRRDPLEVITKLIERLTSTHLDADHGVVALDMAWALAEHPDTPLHHGAPAAWAAAITYVVAWVNGATGPAGSRHVTLDALARDVKAGREAIHERVADVRGYLGILPDDPDWRVEPGVAGRVAELDALASDPTLPPNAVEIAMMLASLPMDVQQRLEAALDASPDDPMAALEPELDRMLLAADTAMLAELDGLSLRETERLALTPWNAPDSLLTIADDTPIEQLGGAELLHDVRRLLAIVHEAGMIRTTQAGNLPRSVVGAFLAQRSLSHDAPFDHAPLPDFPIRNEHDCFPLHRAHVIASMAGLLQVERGRLSVTEEGHDLRADVRAGALHARLLRITFQDADLAEFDRHPAPPSVQFSAGWAMRALLRQPIEWRTPVAWVDRLLVAPVRRTMPSVPDDPFDQTAHALELRVLRWLAFLGLVEMKPVDTTLSPIFRRFQYARAPLMERVVRVHR